MMINIAFCSSLLVQLINSHMEMVVPAPRNSKYLSGVDQGKIDYSMTSPTTSMCKGFAKGPISAHYSPGQKIQVELSGGAKHNGGHCQFAISYDSKKYVVLKTVMEDCMVNTLKYDVELPSNAPKSENAVFAWTWINKTGNREYYMNCADVSIGENGSQSRSMNSGSALTGPELLVANIPGYPTIPEWNGKDEKGESMLKDRKMISISNDGQSQDLGSNNQDNSYNKDENKAEQPKDQQQNNKPQPTNPINNPQPPSNESNFNKGYNAPKFEMGYDMPNFNKGYSPISNGCQNGQMKCISATQFFTCSNSNMYITNCGPGTRCSENQDKVVCGW